MGKVNPNGTYYGRVYDAGESHNATLSIIASDQKLQHRLSLNKTQENKQKKGDRFIYLLID